jgi:hypothetical protein
LTNAHTHMLPNDLLRLLRDVRMPLKTKEKTIK